MRALRRSALGAATVAVALTVGGSGVTIGGSGAPAVISPGDYHVEEITLTLWSLISAGSYLDCPTGQRPISGGTYWHRPGEAPDHTLAGFVNASAPSLDGKLWVGSGYNLSGQTLKLTIVTLCLPISTLGTPAVVRSSVSIGQHQDGARQISCPTGTKVLSGGAFFGGDVAPFADMDPPGSLTSSSVSGDGTKWYASGSNSSPTVGVRLHVIALCAPPAVTGTYTSRVTRKNVRPGTSAASTASCPPAMRVVTGGAVWQLGQFGIVDPTWNVRLMGSAPAATGQSWTAWGRNDAGMTLQLVTTALCLPA